MTTSKRATIVLKLTTRITNKAQTLRMDQIMPEAKVNLNPAPVRRKIQAMRRGGVRVPPLMRTTQDSTSGESWTMMPRERTKCPGALPSVTLTGIGLAPQTYFLPSPHSARKIRELSRCGFTCRSSGSLGSKTKRDWDHKSCGIDGKTGAEKSQGCLNLVAMRMEALIVKK